MPERSADPHGFLESEGLLRAILETAVDAIITIDDRGIIQSLNPATKRLFGYTTNEMVGHNVKMLMPSPYRDEHDKYIQHYLQSGEKKIIGIGRDVVGRRKDGHLFPMHLAVSEVKLPDHRLFTGIVRDITEQKRAEHALRLAAIGEMMTGIAHESRNALQRTQACLEVLAMDLHDSPEALEQLKRIQRAQDDMNRLFKEVRAYATPIQLDVVDVSLASIWQEAWELVAESRMERDTMLTDRFDGVNAICHVDRYRLIQVFRNLMENSLAACTDPVRVDIACAEESYQGRDALRIIYRDNGPGLNAEQQQRVFEPFFTTKTKGSGLGMSITARIVESHGGVITARNGPNSGAEFVITLPRRKT